MSRTIEGAKSLWVVSTVVSCVLLVGSIQAQPPAGGLILWLSSDVGVTTDANGVTVWEDQAGGNNNAVRQAGFGSGYPQLSCGTFPSGEHTVLQFNHDTGLEIQNGTDLSIPELSVYVVAEASVGGGGAIITNYSSFVNWGFGYMVRYRGDGNRPAFFTSAGTQETYGDQDSADQIEGEDPFIPLESGYHYLSGTFSNATGEKRLYADGILTSINFSSMVMTYHGDERQAIGSLREFGLVFGNPEHLFRGGIAEILVYDNVNESERLDVEEYLVEKYFDPNGQAPAIPDYPPTDLICSVDVAGTQVDLNWSLCGTYESQRILRDGQELAALATDASSFVDNDPLEGTHTYEVEATIAGTPSSVSCEVDVVIPVVRGRILHLTADQGVTLTQDGVSLWEDLSAIGGDNSAFRQVEYGPGFPQLGCANFPNGTHAVIQFNGDTGLDLFDPAELNSRDISIYAVVQVSTESGSIITNYTNVVNWGYGYKLRLGLLEKGNQPVFFTSAGTSLTIHDAHSPTVLEDGWYLITATMSSLFGEKRVYVDGVLDLEFTPESPGAPPITGRTLDFHGSERFSIGSNREFDNLPVFMRDERHVGGIAEIIIYDSVSDEQRQIVEAELRAKYFEGDPEANPSFPPTGLRCVRSPDGTQVDLSWESCQLYEALTVFANGSPVANIPEDAVSYTDNGPAVGNVTYEVIAEFVDGSIDGPSCTVSDPRTEGCPPSSDDPRLVLWLDAAESVTSDGSGVVRWEDLAGGDNDAVTRAEGLTEEPWFGEAQPQEATGTLPGGQFPVIQFNGDAGMEIENGTDLNLTELTMFTVVEISPDSGAILSNYSSFINFGFGWAWKSLSRPPHNNPRGVNLFTSAGTCGSHSDYENGRFFEEEDVGSYQVISATFSNTSGRKTMSHNGELVNDLVMGNPDEDLCAGFDGSLFTPEVGYHGDERAAIGSFREFEATRRFIGGIAEILVFDSVDNELHDEVNRYLVKKYITGIQATECTGSGDPTGACCNGSTCDVQTQADCEAGGGTYLGDDALCQVGTCGAATGACCTAGNCDLQSRADCVAGGGTYQGDFSVCDAGRCGPIGTPFRRGDHDGSGIVDITDPLNLLGFLFLGTTPPICEDASDGDNSAALDISDALNLLGFLFLGSFPLNETLPGPMNCGPDPDIAIDPDGPGGFPEQPATSLGCDTYPSATGTACP
jgi:hypothetical protein